MKETASEIYMGFFKNKKNLYLNKKKKKKKKEKEKNNNNNAELFVGITYLSKFSVLICLGFSKIKCYSSIMCYHLVISVI